MKTYEQILRETIEDDFRFEVTTAIPPESRAAKEYAKQWIEEAALMAAKEASIKPYSFVKILDLKKKIDAQ